MDKSLVASEASRLGMDQLAAEVAKYGVTVLHESIVASEQLIRIFDNRLRRAEARNDRDVISLVENLLAAFNDAQLGEIKLTHIQAGKMDAMLYGTASGESILAAVVLAGSDS